MKCVRVIKYLSQTVKVLIMKCKKKKNRETLNAGEEQEDSLFICLVCSLQQPSLQIIWALKGRSETPAFPFIDFIYYTTDFRLCEAVRLILRDFCFLLSSKSPQVEMIFVPAAEFMLSCVIWFVGKKKKLVFLGGFFKKPACFCSCWSLWAYCRSISRSFSSLHLIKADRDFILAPSGRPGLYCRWCSSQAIKTIRAQRLFVLITSRLTSLLHNKGSSRKGPHQLALREIIAVLSVYYYSSVTEW